VSVTPSQVHLAAMLGVLVCQWNPLASESGLGAVAQYELKGRSIHGR
jgi:hypothetical protein